MLFSPLQFHENNVPLLLCFVCYYLEVSDNLILLSCRLFGLFFFFLEAFRTFIRIWLKTDCLWSISPDILVFSTRKYRYSFITEKKLIIVLNTISHCFYNWTIHTHWISTTSSFTCFTLIHFYFSWLFFCLSSMSFIKFSVEPIPPLSILKFRISKIIFVTDFHLSWGQLTLSSFLPRFLGNLGFFFFQG